MTPPDSSGETPPARPGLPTAQSRLGADLQVEAFHLQRAITQGAYWFYWVAALSLINSIIALSGGNFSFLAGLAISQIADVYAAHMGFFGPYFSIGIALIVALFVCAFGYLASHGSRVAFIVGMILYALDGLVFVKFSIYVPALFHAYVLYRMWQGWGAVLKLNHLRANSPTLAAPGSAGR